MKVSKKGPRNANRTEFSKEFLSEFGIVSNKHEVLSDSPKNKNNGQYDK